MFPTESAPLLQRVLVPILSCLDERLIIAISSQLQVAVQLGSVIARNVRLRDVSVCEWRLSAFDCFELRRQGAWGTREVGQPPVSKSGARWERASILRRALHAAGWVGVVP